MPQNPNILRTLRGGDYALTRIIGEGSFGITYEGYEQKGRRPIAAKLLKVETPPVIPTNLQALSVQEQLFYSQLRNNYLETQSQMKDAFSREAATHARLVHPNIVRIYDFDFEEGQPYLVMELASTALNHYLRTGKPLEPHEAANFVLKTAQGIQHAHDNGVIHRDLKPGNVLVFLDPTGNTKTLKSTDFGIALPLHSESSLQPQKPIGTLAYMAPEHANGKAVKESDQYAAGAMAYEFFTGRKFFTDKAKFHFQDPKAFDEIVRILGLQDDIRPLVEAVKPAILKAVAEEPHDRYPSILAFAQDVDARLSEADKSVRRGKIFEAAKIQQRTSSPLHTDNTSTLSVLEDLGQKAFNLMMQSKSDEGLQIFDRAIQLDPKNSIVYVAKGRYLEMIGKYEAAIEAYNKAITLDPKNSIAFIDKGWLLCQIGSYTEAMEAYDKAIELDPKSYNAYRSKAILLEKLGKYESAIEVYNKMIELEPEIPPAYRPYAYEDKGRMLEKLGRYIEAIEVFDRAFMLNPEYFTFRYLKSIEFKRARELELLSGIPDAMKTYSEAAKSGSRYAKSVLRILREK